MDASGGVGAGEEGEVGGDEEGSGGQPYNINFNPDP